MQERRRIGVIVVPLDGSALAEEALPHAVLLARKLDVPLRLLRVVPEDATPE
ncbi:MAG: universal stress protein, partial [Thermorudis peleae]|nr:universal stress protein [Thermorudis peleae]